MVVVTVKTEMDCYRELTQRFAIRRRDLLLSEDQRG